ncbi:DegT/DnrJ/EryC1/StrS family aminotransferase [Streptomyces hesseae]|uniref:DegT/DnrJ/EryC1/StrS family aminotransferase n=1 Tax=Streptomyces hesseae TaxID=3075519 RepID=A0ABU2SR75_9ACTN|nr:DegT/DnrJ/EryC1/StrS family aminotransferase [Streptomyces sp. DSM 40473]MDT0450300.1 DegT/DnrJ/EryC1/StrS family aminotransferase [Streptomyces sp. DSM 40473]
MRTEEKLVAVGVGAGSEVIVPSYATAGAAEAVRNVGALPVFADIDPVTFCLDPASVAGAVTSRTAAIVPVSLFGHPADLAALRHVAAGRTLPVIDHVENIEHVEPEELARRRSNAACLDARLSGVVTPTAAPGAVHRYDSYVVRVPGNGRPDRDAFARALRARGVRCHVPVQTPVHRLPSFMRDMQNMRNMRELWLPETERAADECLALPMDDISSRRDLQRLVSACNTLGGLLPAAA